MVAQPTQAKGFLPDDSSIGTLESVAGLSVQEVGSGGLRQTIITLTDVAMTITDALAYASKKLYTMPAGVIGFQLAIGTFTFTTTSTIASTLNSGVSVQFGVGTAAASATTLATTMINIAPGTGQTVPTFTSSTTINVASAAATTYLRAGTILDGSATPLPIYLNVALGTGTDIDADATITVTGKIIITWIQAGDI